MPSRRLIVTLFVLVFFILQTGTSYLSLGVINQSNSQYSDMEDRECDEGNQYPVAKNSVFQTSADSINGVIDPVIVEQYGYSSTGELKARTDTAINDQSSIPIDNTTGWVGSEASIELFNMKRQYAENGQFDIGTSGTTYYPDTVTTYPNNWDCDWYDPSYGGAPGNQNLSVTYDSDEEYIVLQTIGQFDDSLGYVEYRHYDGTYIYWNQTIDNVPYSDNLTLSFMYNYVSGVIDKSPYEVAGYLWLDVLIDGEFVDYINLITQCESRGTWYEFVITDITDAPSRFNLQIGISLMTYYISDTYFLTNPGGDYDEDESLDFDNARINRVLLDNITFTSAVQPTYEEVGLTFNAGTFNTPIIEEVNGGYATISNPSYWTSSSLDVGVSANVSISCNYEVTLLLHKYSNSTWTTQPTRTGVAYLISSIGSASLTLYTYIGSAGVSVYENFSVKIYLPPDWENTTAYDPFLNDVTGQCAFISGLLTIPTSILDRLGWWQISLDSPNYAKSITPQIYEADSWFDNTLFRPSNVTRATIEIGTQSQVPESTEDPVEIDWILPNGTIWVTDTIQVINNGFVNSSTWVFGGVNTTAGLWKIQVFWNNGTELAYGFDTFELYHRASASLKYPEIETEYGVVLSNQITLIDIDTGQYLLDDSVSMTANWSDTTVVFSPNFAKNWWQADFDTTLIQNGLYVVVVDVSRPYFDSISAEFTITTIFETSLEILNAGSIPIERGLNEIFTVLLSYELWNGTGIVDADPTVTSTSPQEGIDWINFNDNGAGLYSLDILSNISTTYEITITFSKPYHYNSTDSFTLIINKISTELELVNGTADIVQYGSSYRLVVEYRNSTGVGLSGADVQIVTVTPETGLEYLNFTPIHDGLYEITFTPSTTGTFSIVISASIFNHQTQYVTFTLTGVVVPSVLTSLPSSTIIQVNQTFVLQLNFHDENLNPIDTATVTVLDPPAGIDISPASPIGNGLYNITIRSSQIDVYSLLFRASAPFYQSSIVGFTVSVTALSTTLDITNVGSIPVENGLNEVFTVQLSYELLNGTGVLGAQYSVTFTGPVNGLACSNFIDYDNGLYSFDIVCNTSATYGVTITLSKAYYYSMTDSFVLIIGETGSELILLNGTADVVLFGDNYRLVVEYRNSTGYGLPFSTVCVVTATPLTGLNYTNFTYIDGGYYEIVLTPDAAGTFSIVISASLINHETQYTTFTLTASGIPTILSSIPSEKTVAVNQTYTLQLRFLEEDLAPIEDANITLINPPSGLIITSTVPIGNGLYNISLQSFTIQTYDLLFRASKKNYQSASAAFTFDVTEIQTTIIFEDDVTSTTVEFEEAYELLIYYDRINPIAPVSGANITILPADVTNLAISIVEYSGYYIITIRGEQVGTWALTVVAEKTNYRIATKQFFFEVEKIDTTVQGSSPLETLYFGRSYQFTFDYIFESNSSNVQGATIDPSGPGADWVTYVELGSGQYLVNLTPQELGEHSVILTFEKMGFESLSFRLNFEVGRIPITIEILQGLSAHEYSQSLVLVNITESDSGDPVSGIEVFCYIIDPNGAEGSSITMIETATAGVYSAYISMPVAEGVYQIKITCEATNYLLSSPFTAGLQPQRDFMSMVWVTTIRYYPIIIVFAAIGVGLVYRRAARKRRIRENKETLAIKRRFDDIRSILGVIVLHKDSGLPVYSKILREGLEETVISAFITAITSFRGEFDIETTSEEWGLIPISDIVRVISTNKLVCAFITTGNPSPEQRERMIQFAKTVGFIFDETMEDVPVVVLDHHTTAQFDALFEDILDGQLLRTFKLDETKKFPTNTCALERIARKQGVEFKLEELASEIATCGLEETRVYKAIMVALENHYLVRTEDSPFSTELLRAPDAVHEEVE